MAPNKQQKTTTVWRGGGRQVDSRQVDKTFIGWNLCLSR